MFPSKPQPPPSTPYYNLEIINLMEGLQSDLGPDWFSHHRTPLQFQAKLGAKKGGFCSNCPFHDNCNK